ncbi:DUF885 domain-containing protein [Rothia uropygioeca]|uniref:DUF885 domain-containing protein n=1 Tax=Kocuria sp. 257 TaxID=2021970 RepID=UPI001011FE01|nr:DUF885 domain-containing protein [Kocuria sp. 257]
MTSPLPAALKLDRETTDIDRVANSYYDKLMELDPATATIEGIPGHETEYGDLSPAGTLEFIRAAREALEQVNEIDPQDDVDRVTLDAMNESLGLIIEMHEAGLGDWELNNLATPAHDVRQVFDLMPQSTQQDWLHIVGRMKNVPQALAGFRESLAEAASQGRIAAARQVRLLIQQFGAYTEPDGFFDQLAQRAAASDPTLDNTARAAAQGARTAYADLAAFLRTRLLPQAPERDAVGRERYGLHSRAFLGAAVNLDETYAWGVAELDRIIAEQQRVADRIKSGASIREAKSVLDEDPSRKLHGKEELRDWMQELSDRAVEDLAKEHFVIEGPMRDLECMIAPTQEGGIYYTGPSADFSRPGRMWWSITEGESEFTTWSETSTVYHEGVPGHHLQISTAAAMAESMNRWRANGLWYSGHGEGWALYAERLMAELGYLDDPGDMMGMLDGQRMRAARVVFDIGVHCELEIPQRWVEELDLTPGTWSPDSGYEFLRHNLAIPQGQLDFEFNRYLGWCGQAPSYKIGQRMWEQLRDEAVARGESLKEFHTRALKVGSVGLDTLKRALSA